MMSASWLICCTSLGTYFGNQVISHFQIALELVVAQEQCNRVTQPARLNTIHGTSWSVPMSKDILISGSLYVDRDPGWLGMQYPWVSLERGCVTNNGTGTLC